MQTDDHFLDGFPVIAAQGAGVVPQEHFVFGERNSGTNLAHALLTTNIPALAESAGDRIGPHGFRYGWKHGFPQMVAAPASCLAIVLFRAPDTWLRSMHARPWHAAPELAALPFSEFLRAQWHSRVDEQNFGVARGGLRWGGELHYDRHPLTGQRFENILALRRAKAAGFLCLAARFESCLMLRHEDVSRDPEGFVRFVSERYGLARYKRFRPVEARRGRIREGKFLPTDYAPLDPEDHQFVWAELDRAQEQRLGYEPEGDTHD